MQMTVNAELLRYYKILKSSNCVQIAREMMRLQKDEYLLRFEGGKTCTTRTKDALRKLTDTPSDEQYYYKEVQAYVQKNIIDFYDLPYDATWVLSCIFYGYQFVPEPFTVHPPRKNEEGNLTISVEVAQRLSADSKRELLKQVGKAVEEGINLLAKRKPDVEYNKIKPIKNLDEKYALAKEYPRLLKLSSTERKSEEDDFVKRAFIAFNKKGTYTFADVRIDLKDFKKMFGKENIR